MYMYACVYVCIPEKDITIKTVEITKLCMKLKAREGMGSVFPFLNYCLFLSYYYSLLAFLWGDTTRVRGRCGGIERRVGLGFMM